MPEAVTSAEDNSTPLFAQRVSPTVRLIVLAMAAIALMTLDHRRHFGDSVDRAVMALTHPLLVVVGLPVQFSERVGDWTRSREMLTAENEQLRQQLLLNESRLQRMDQLERENMRLRRLLNSSIDIEPGVIIASLVRVGLDPYQHILQVDRGARDGAFVGQTVIDAQGIVGQIDRVGPVSAHVRLITDPSHAIPVQVNRNGLRTIAYGSGRIQSLDLPHLANNADIRPGDLLVTSGLGGRFLPGYPVAEVQTVNPQPGEPFARVTATPVAALDRSQQLLLVRSQPSPRDELSAAPTPVEPAAPVPMGDPPAAAATP